MRRLAFPLGVLTLVTVLSRPVAAEALSADRPGAANPPDVVGTGAVQVEGGVSFARQTHGRPNESTLTIPGALLRFGVLRTLELRLSADGYVLALREGAHDRSSGSDLVVGARAALFDQRSWLPGTALELDLSLPTGSAAVTSDGVDPTGLLLVEWQLGERFVLDGNLGFASVSPGPHASGRSFQVSPALSLTFSWSERGSVFAEYYATFADHGVADQQAADAGLSWLLSDGLQLDLSASAGLDDAAPDFTISTGVAWRFFPF